jgi:hypothetical protein
MSQPIDDGGPAFPCEALADYRDTEATKFKGMSLRDWFAGQALAGLVFHNDYGARSDDEIANGAYAYADAMIAARKGGAE